MYGVVAPVRYSPLYSICSYQPIMHWKVELIRTNSAIYKYFLWGLPWQTIEHTCNLLLKWHTSSQVCQIYRNCCWFVHCNREVESINEKQWIWFLRHRRWWLRIATQSSSVVSVFAHLAESGQLSLLFITVSKCTQSNYTYLHTNWLLIGQLLGTQLNLIKVSKICFFTSTRIWEPFSYVNSVSFSHQFNCVPAAQYWYDLKTVFDLLIIPGLWIKSVAYFRIRTDSRNATVISLLADLLRHSKYLRISCVTAPQVLTSFSTSTDHLFVYCYWV